MYFCDQWKNQMKLHHNNFQNGWYACKPVKCPQANLESFNFNFKLVPKATKKS